MASFFMAQLKETLLVLVESYAEAKATRNELLIRLMVQQIDSFFETHEVVAKQFPTEEE